MREFLEISFVALLSPDALLFVWDHCFLYGWTDTVPAMVCCDIILLSKRSLVNFHGDVIECLEVLKKNSFEITTRQLQEVSERSE